MKKIFKDRLLKLAEHLERGKKLHKKFDFAYLTASPNPNYSSEAWNAWYNTVDELGNRDYAKEPQQFFTLKPYHCGTAGCALGEMPVVSRKWNFSKDSEPHLKGSRRGAFDSAESWFGITEDESSHLFEPDNQNPELFGGCRVGEKATAKQIAKNIRAFVRIKEKKVKR
jgi:hypothetical protein